jgi:hypothetical protein
MQPGENRWIGLRFPAAAGKAGQVLAVSFDELHLGVPVNGFAIGARLAPIGDVVREKLERHRSEMVRLLAEVEGAERSAAQAAKLARAKRIDAAAYVKFVGSQAAVLERAVSDLSRDGKALGLAAALSSLERALKSKDPGAVAVCHDCVLNRMDSALTMRQLQAGDVAGILHTVRWQRDLLVKEARAEALECGPKLLDASDRFIAGYGRREVTNRDYQEFVRGELECLHAIASELKDDQLAKQATELAAHLDGPLPALQKAHQDYVQRLDAVLRG